MRVLAFLVAFACMNLTSNATGAAPKLEAGISLELAQWRAKQYRDLHYGLKISLTEGADWLQGDLTLDLAMAKPVDVVLDWRGREISVVQVNGKAVPAENRNEHLRIPANAFKAGQNRIELRFQAPVAVSGAPVTRYRDREDGSEYVYTLLVPADASTLFPCFDQPDLKARFSLELSLPANWTAVSNAPVLQSSAGKFSFSKTEPISTYLFAFAAGPFETLTAPGDETRLVFRRSRLERARTHAAEVLRLNRESVAWFERYFERKFPFAKYDLVLVPEFAFGGMEHAGASFLNEERVLFPAPPSAADLLRRAQLIFHETSHQWFGDLVTMRWFDDLWLKEGFANFMAAKATEALLPQFNAWTAFHLLKLSGVRTDATQGTTAIRYPLTNLADAKSAYGAIVYSKGPAVLRQAEFYLGEEVFTRAVRDFVRRHAYGAATWHDLVHAFERASGKRLARWAEAWVQRRGQPTVRYRDGALEQNDALGEGGFWPMKLRLWHAGKTTDVLFDRKSIPFRKQGFLFPNAGDYGYGRFLLDPESQGAALTLRTDDTLLQAQLVEALWEAVRDADLAPERFLTYALERLPETRDDIALAGLLARMETAFRRYLNDAQRDRLAPPLERALLEGARAADSESRRLLHLRAYLDIAWSAQGLADLKRLLDGALTVPGPAIASRDRFRMVQRLLVRGDAEAASRLAAQAAADRSDDGRRYAYAAGAAEATVKRGLFHDFLEDKALPESWIEAALGAFNSPEQAALTQPLLAEALARLPELKRNRRIFFVLNWLAAFIGGQTDEAALAQVRAALRNDRLERDLRLKLLEAVDGLERAVKIRARYG
jgi:aminopeptidase N